MDVLFDHSAPYFSLFTMSPFSSRSSEASSSAIATNYVGAVLFWAYIAAALYLTASVVRTLSALRRVSRVLGYGCRGFYVATFALLAGLSFASLSWNMLNVLAHSYAAWARATGTPYPTSLLGPQGPLSVGLHPWAWSVQSTPFADFARAITATPLRRVWAQAELGLALVASMWMAIEGRTASNYSRPLPRLWTFLGLLQILPTSLVVNLFILAQLLTPRPPVRRQLVLRSPGAWLGCGLLYFFVLFEAGQPEREPYLIYLVLLARALLAMPFVLSLRWLDPVRDEQELQALSPLSLLDVVPGFAIIAAWGVLHQLYFAIAGSSDSEAMNPAQVDWEEGLWAVWAAKSEHPAVATMAYDFIQCAITFSSWVCTTHEARPQMPAEMPSNPVEQEKHEGKRGGKKGKKATQ